MSPLFYEDSLGAKLVEKANAAMDAARTRPADPEVDLAIADEPFVEDPVALHRAELAARGIDPQQDYERVTADWVVALGPSKLSGLIDSAGFTSRMVVAPLETADIPYAWNPYPPEEMPGYRYGYGAVDRPFTLLVPPERVEEAISLLDLKVGSASVFGLPASPEHGEESRRRRRLGLWLMFGVFIGFDLILVVLWAVLSRLGII